MTMILEPKFLCTIRSIFGSKGDAWLTQLSELLEEFEQRWRLTLFPPFENLSINYVAPALRENGTPVVLKLGVPNVELSSEVEALKVYNSRGAVHLLESDADKGALLLERLQPGTLLSTLGDDEKATRIAAGVLKDLWRPEPSIHHFKSIADWARGLDRISSLFPQGIPIPLKLIDQARSLFAELRSSQTSTALLHGDFHHYNILSTSDDWCTIDPKGIIGEPEFDLAPFFENQIDPQDPTGTRKTTEKRMAIFCEMLGFDRKRVQDWLIAHSILSAWWLVEDHGVDCEKIASSLAAIEIFQSLKN